MKKIISVLLSIIVLSSCLLAFSGCVETKRHGVFMLYGAVAWDMNGQPYIVETPKNHATHELHMTYENGVLRSCEAIHRVSLQTTSLRYNEQGLLTEVEFSLRWDNYWSYEYNDDQLIKISKYSNRVYLDGHEETELYQEIKYTYGQDGALASEEHVDGSGRTLGKFTYKSDGKGRVIEKIAAGKTVYRYEGKNVVEAVGYTSAGEAISKETYEYKKGILTKYTAHSLTTGLVYNICAWDEYGSPILEEHYDTRNNADGKCERRMAHEFSENGALTAIVITDEGVMGMNGRVELTFDESDNLVQADYYYDGIYYGYVSYGYDAGGKIDWALVERYDADGKLIEELGAAAISDPNGRVPFYTSGVFERFGY
jgi:hypothetical protein